MYLYVISIKCVFEGFSLNFKTSGNWFKPLEVSLVFHSNLISVEWGYSCLVSIDVMCTMHLLWFYCDCWVRFAFSNNCGVECTFYYVLVHYWLVLLPLSGFWYDITVLYSNLFSHYNDPAAMECINGYIWLFGSLTLVIKTFYHLET